MKIPRLNRSTVSSRSQKRKIRNQVNRANLEYTEQERALQRDQRLHVEGSETDRAVDRLRNRLRRADPAYSDNEQVLFNAQRSSRRGNSTFRQVKQLKILRVDRGADRTLLTEKTNVNSSMLDALLVEETRRLERKSNLKIVRVDRGADRTLFIGQMNVNKTILGELVSATT